MSLQIVQVIYCENHNMCYYFTDTSELQSASIATFPFGTKFVLCKERPLHMQKPKSQEGTHGVVQVSDRGMANRTH